MIATSPQPARGSLFPFRGGRRGKSGNKASALLFCVALLAPTLSLAESRALEQIRQAIETHLSQELRKEAEAQGWGDFEFSHDIRLPRATGTLTACAVRVRIRPIGAANPAAERQRFEAACPGTDGWPVVVNAQVGVFVPAVHTQAVIERGQVIEANDLKLERVAVAALRRGGFHRTEEVVGMVAARRLRPNQVLTPVLVEGAAAVRRGDVVKIVAVAEGIEASTKGEALADGQPGDVIRVRNLSSDKTIHAKVIERGVVTSTY